MGLIARTSLKRPTIQAVKPPSQPRIRRPLTIPLKQLMNDYVHYTIRREKPSILKTRVEREELERQAEMRKEEEREQEIKVSS